MRGAGRRGLLAKVASWAESLLEIVYPRHCVSCGGVPAAEAKLPHVCEECFRRVQLIEAPKCECCGFPFYGETDSSQGCPHCVMLVPEFGRGWSIALFRGPVRGLVHELKYMNGLWVLGDIGEIARRAPGLADFVEGATLVPVPLHPRKERERGYNQSELIAGALQKALPVKGMERLLSRVADTPSQTKFNRQDRYRNLRNAFSLSSKGVIEPEIRYIIVDDVFTTGSTLNACASVLRRAGARRVDVLTLGHG